MSTVLTIAGKNLDVHSLIKQVRLSPDRLFEQASRSAISNLKSEEKSAQNFVTFHITGSNFQPLEFQLALITKYLKAYKKDILKLTSYPKVEASLDIGIFLYKDVFTYSDRLPIKFLRLLTETQLSLEISHYPCSD